MTVVLSILTAAFLAAGGSARSAPVSRPQPEFPRGQLVEHVESTSFPQQRYAMYVPGSHDPARPAPILYLMDPRGRARVPAELFRPVAERFGYILISSYNTISDTNMEPNLRALQAMWSDTHDWFRIDDQRVYLAGFSGTARTACLLARHLSGTFTGVIGAAAGFHPDYPPTKDFRFAYFGTAGDVDYNHYEMQRLEEQLAATGLRHRVEGFVGPHSWMPSELAAEAVEWMELQAMRAGLRPADAALVDAWWQRDEARAEEDVEAGRLIEASWRYGAMARDYESLQETAAAARRESELGGTPEARRELQARQRAYENYQIWVASAMQMISESFRPGSAQPAITDAELATELEVARLRRAADGPDPAAALEAQRRLNSIEVQLGFYLPRDALATAEYLRAEHYLSVAIRMDDQSPVSWYLMAVTQARLREPAESLKALGRAVEVGYRDAAAVEAERAFDALRTRPEFAALLGRMRNAG